jgi:hypothetical protein
MKKLAQMAVALVAIFSGAGYCKEDGMLGFPDKSRATPRLLRYNSNINNDISTTISTGQFMSTLECSGPEQGSYNWRATEERL